MPDATEKDDAGLAEAYARDGYAVLEGVFTGEALEALRAETVAIGRGDRGEIFGYDLVQGDTDEATLANILAVHFPHKFSGLCREALSEPRIVTFLNAVIGPDVKAMQSMLFVKSAGKPGQPWHQDEHFIPTRDRSLAGVWIALDDATVENGCMWMIPGSHHDGIIWPMRPHDDPRYDHNPVAHGFPYDEEGGVPIEVRAGDVAVFNGYTLHRSLNNRAERGTRRALVNHYMNARSLLPWDMGPVPTPRADYRDVVLVSGEDPYAWKGTESIAVPFIRPESEEKLAELSARVKAVMAAGADEKAPA